LGATKTVLRRHHKYSSGNSVLLYCAGLPSSLSKISNLLKIIFRFILIRFKGERINEYKIVIGKPEMTERSQHRWEDDNNKFDFK
jgi:hypothetical protein